MRRLYAVMFDKDDRKLRSELVRQFGDDNVYEVSETTYMVSTTEEAEAIPGRLGLEGDAIPSTSTGVLVFSLNGSYSGYFRDSAWDWIEVKRRGVLAG
jgi:hypothetical protein